MAKEKLFKSLSSKCYTILCVGEIKKTRRPFNYIKKEIELISDYTDIENDDLSEDKEEEVEKDEVTCPYCNETFEI